MTTINEQRLEERFTLEGTPYRAHQNIGRGAYGIVCKAHDTAENRNVAIKKIPRAFTAITLAKRSLREVRILRDLAHENIVSILDMFTAPGQRGRDIYVVFDLMETDLHQIIHSRQTLVDQHFQYFLYQILRGLKYLHSVGIVHRDLKPSNIFVNGDCLLKIGDFGMSRSIQQCHVTGNYMTQYVSTRWYRAPELLFSLVDYTTKVDIWSAGCIFAEMIMRRQLFPGKDAVSQVKMIVYYLGTPSKQVLERVSSDMVLRWIENCGKKEPLPLEAFLPKATPQALHIISRLLQVAPWDRCSAEEALAMPYLSTYHDPATEPVGPAAVFFDADEIERLPEAKLKDALEEEAEYFESIRGPYNISKADNINDEEMSSTSKPEGSTKSEGEVKKIYTAISRAPASCSFTSYRDNMDGSNSGNTTPQLSSESSSGSVETVICREDSIEEQNEDLEDESNEENLMEKAEKVYPGCSRKGIEWFIPESGITSAPPTMNPYTSDVGRKQVKKALDRRILLKERMLQNALRAAHNKTPKTTNKKADKGRVRLKSDIPFHDKVLLERWCKEQKARHDVVKETRDTQRKQSTES